MSFHAWMHGSYYRFKREGTWKYGVFKFKESRSVSAYLELYKIIMNMSEYLKKKDTVLSRFDEKLI